MPVIIKSPIDVVVKLIYNAPETGKSGGGSKTGKGKKKSGSSQFFTDEDLIRKSARADKHTIPPKDLFRFIDALDAYEIDKNIEETLVVDITEITNDGLVVIHIEPKKMIRYQDVYDHIDSMIVNAFKVAEMNYYEYEIKKILFRIYKPGVPSSVINDLSELKEKVQELYEQENKDEMKSYI